MKDHFRMFAAYNQWANAAIYKCCNDLSQGDLELDRGAFFKSILGTLNHNLVGDLIWMHRFDGTGERPETLDTILYHNLAMLRTVRIEQDIRIISFFEDVSAAEIETPLTYRNMAGEMNTANRYPLYAHFFNHQTHHRGQIHDQLSQAGAHPPQLDLVYFLPTWTNDF